MQTVAWTDEKLGERFERIDDRFDHVERNLAELRRETKSEFAAVRREMKSEFAAVRQSIERLETAVHRGNYATIVALIGVIGAILAKGG